MTSQIRRLIGSRIKAYRLQKGCTQAELAEAIGCEVTTLGRYERGQYAPDGEQLIKISIFFDASPMDFLPGTVDIDRQAILDLRADLIDLIYGLNNPADLKYIMRTIQEIPNNSRKKN